MSSSSFQIPQTVAALRKLESTYEVGRACGHLLYNIKPLVARHLNHSADFQNESIEFALISTTEFTAAVNAHLHILRLHDGCTEKFPDDLKIDRKARRPRRKYLEKYIALLEARFKGTLRRELGGLMGTWTQDQNAKFNRGVDLALVGTRWAKYPVKNVCLEVGDGDWKEWLIGRCDELGMEESRAGRPTFVD
jgi:hypothetical protein